MKAPEHLEDVAWREISPDNLQPTLDRAALVLIEFWAPDCLSSRLVLPTRAALQKRYEQMVLLCRCMVRCSDPLCSDIGVTGLPALLLFQGGRRVNRWIGDTHVSLITRVIDARLSKAPI